MKRKIFLQFFLITLLSTLLMFACGVVAVNVNAKNILRSRLSHETEIVSALMRDTSDFSAFDRYKNSGAFRLTVLSTDGNVIYESDTAAELENHAGREEIVNALNGTPKAVERYSETFRAKMTYYALKTTLQSGEEVVVRLAVKSSEISSYISVSVPLMAAALIGVLALSMLFSGILCKQISERISDVSDSLRSLNEGRYHPLAVNSHEPEFYRVFNEINDLNANIYAHIASEEQEHGKLNAVLESVSQGIVALDEKRQAVFANQSASALLGGRITAEEKSLIYLIENADLYDEIASHLNENYVFEWQSREKTLSVAVTKITDVTIKNRISSIVVVTDITAAKAALRQRSEFFANASHELKTPVTVIQGLTEILLAKDVGDETARKQIERLHKECLRLASLVSDMLKLSNLENGTARTEETSVAVDLRECAREALSELAETIKEKNVTASIQGDGTVFADPKKIYELVQNLCSNAVNYNKPNGKISVEISETAEKVTLCVSDTGIGIEKEHLPRLCERFYRVDKSRSKRTGGTGLGLAIVKHVCALYNAELSIESEYGEGTRVSVIFFPNASERA
ncbi:MAG: ATP-binding protein [Candidatus Scatosoma sp.]